MTLGERYNTAMEHLELSGEAYDRILANICSMNVAPRRHAISIRFPEWKRWAAMAACATVIVLCALTYSSFKSTESTDLSSMTGSPVAEYASLSELSEALGFTIHEPKDLPFMPTETAYTGLYSKTAQIRYSTTDKSLLFFKSTASEITGDYAEYTQVQEKSVNGVSVTLKGREERISSATWSHNGFTYLLYFSPDVTENIILASVESVITAEDG